MSRKEGIPVSEGKNQLIQPDSSGTIQRLSVAEVYQALSTGTGGLSSAEAEARLQRYGRNAIQEKKGTPLIVKFLSNFTHLMAILLWIAGIIGFIAQMPELGVAIWMVNIINGVFSFMQEFKAEKATEALKKLLPATTRVLRDDEERRVLAEELVPGDIILLEEGDKISADCRLVAVNELSVNQSTLTGESHPVPKTSDAVLRTDLSRSEFANLIFAGTNVAAGTGRAIIVSTGMATEFGKIAGLTQNISVDLSPLQKEMARLTRIVSAMAFGIGVFFLIAALLLARADIAESFIFAMV